MIRSSICTLETKGWSTCRTCCGLKHRRVNMKTKHCYTKSSVHGKEQGSSQFCNDHKRLLEISLFFNYFEKHCLAKGHVLSYDDNCQHTIKTLHAFGHFMHLKVIVKTDPIISKQMKRANLPPFPFFHVFKILLYAMPNITEGSLFIAPEKAERLSRATHGHIANKTQSQ